MVRKTAPTTLWESMTDDGRRYAQIVFERGADHDTAYRLGLYISEYGVEEWRRRSKEAAAGDPAAHVVFGTPTCGNEKCVEAAHQVFEATA